MEYFLDDGIIWQLSFIFISLVVGEYYLSVCYVDGSCVLEWIEIIYIISLVVLIIIDV